MSHDFRSSNIALSIIVTAHNLQHFILVCLDSVVSALNESISSCEMILIDDASEDSTTEIMIDFAKNRQNVTYYRTDFRNIGKVRNFGLSLCSGDYVTMIDGDDILCENSLKMILSFIKKEKPDLYLSPLKECRNTIELSSKYHWSIPCHRSLHSIIKAYLIHKKFQAHLGGKIIKRKLLNENPFPEYTCYEDAIVFPKILISSKKIFMDSDSFYLHRKRENSLSRSLNVEKVSHLVSSIMMMDDLFGEEFRHYTACHAVDALNKHAGNISTEQSALLHNLVKKTSKMKFLFNPFIRLSFKRKYFAIMRENK